MRFAEYKQQVLARTDKSRKKSIDQPIRRLVGMMNTHPGMVTLSSCSGRAMLLTPGRRKHETLWHYVTHDLPQQDLRDAYARLRGRVRRLDFKYEGAILHVAIEDPQLALRVLHLAVREGWKHSGLISIQPTRSVLELVIPLTLATVIGEGDTWLDESFFRLLVAHAAEKQRENWRRLTRFETAFQQEFLLKDAPKE